MKCKNCGHELETADYYPSIVCAYEHIYSKFWIFYKTKIKCDCGCVNPEPEKEAKK